MFGGGFGMGMGSGLTELLRRQDVRKELELLDDQVKQLEEFEQKQRDRMREAFSQLRPPGQPGSRDQGRNQGGDQPRDPGRGQGAPKPQVDFRQLMEQQNKETRAELAQILLPHQLKRLEQLSAQLRTQGGGMSLLSGDIAKEAGVTDQQRDQLRSKVEEIERELRKKEAELRRQARDQVISLLPADQQQKIQEQLGEPFTFEVQMPPQFGPPGGGTPRGPERKN